MSGPVVRFLLTPAVCLGAAAALMVVPARAETGSVALEHVSSLVGQADRASGSAQATLVAEALAAIKADPDLNDNDWLTAPLVASPPDLSEEQIRLAAA